MKTMKKAVFATLILAFLLFNSLFILDQREQAILMQFGEAVKTFEEPGLKFKAPFIQNIMFFEKRVLNLFAEEKEVIAKDQKRLIVNAYAKYVIKDPLAFFKTVRDEAGARSRLNSVLDSSLRQTIADVPLASLLTVERADIMAKISQLVNNQVKGFGIDVIDVRIMRADLPKENSDAIYKRMQTDREKEAKEFRAQGAEEAQIIKAKADKERTIILADADKQSQTLMGEGDSIASLTYANAYGRDTDFFAFFRTMQAYESAIKKDNTTVIMSPDSEFLRYFKSNY
jgi:modulator of FtsH protease HflC